MASSSSRPGHDSESSSRRSSSSRAPLLEIPGSDPYDSELGPRRRSSLSHHIGSLRQMGGVNSFDNFVQSWNRAAHYLEIAPRASFSMSTDDELDDEHGGRQKSRLRQEVDRHGYEDEALEDDTDDHSDDTETGKSPSRNRISASAREERFDIQPHLASPLIGSQAQSYGSFHSRTDEDRLRMRNAAKIWKEQQAAKPDAERAPLLVKQVEEDGKLVTVIVGQSTLPQTIFNSVNVLIGIGLLSLPLGIRYAGWLFGLTFLLFAAIVTAYTARILAKCLEIDVTLVTFSDIAYISFGHVARVATSILFCLELLAACVALVVLFADSLNDLIPSRSKDEWKIICGIILFPLSMLPLRVLSFTSILGIFCSVSIVLVVVVDGFIKPSYPGSLRDPAKTYLFPENWMTLPLSVGLLMSPWGGNSVFPNVYRDMRHPKKFGRNIKISFTATYLLDLLMGVVGVLMFGDSVRDEVTGNILRTPGYPESLNIVIVVLIAIIPLTKVPLNARPIITLLERIFGVDAITISEAESLIGLGAWTRGMIKLGVRLFCTILFVAVAIAFPAFDSIMAFLGSALCFTICVILPLMFHLKLFGREIPLWERVMNWFLIVVCTIMAVIGTIWAFLPKEKIHAGRIR